MKSQIPFYLQTVSGNAHLNHYLLNEGRGLEKQDVLNVYYNDTVGKRELVNELLLSALLPKQWGNNENARELPYAQELNAVLIDVQGQFSCYKFIERVRQYYDQHQLYETVEGGQPGAQTKEETEDKHQFIKQVLSNLYLFQVFTAVEFNLTVRSLAQFLKTHKNIGLIVIDGLHLIENVEMYSIKMSDKYGSSALGSGGKPGRKVSNNVQAMAAQMEVPTSDDFFGGMNASSTGTATPVALKQTPSTTNVIRQSFNLKRGGKMGAKIDFNYFDSKLIERAIGLLSDYKKIY